MASPQIENGYTRIANEILESLCKTRIAGEARQVIDVVFRKTYGYGKKDDYISLSQFCLLTGMRKADVCRAINKAISMNIIKVISKKANGLGNKYCIVKDFDSWKALAKKRRGVAKKQMSISKKANNSLAKKRHTKERYKETITKEIAETSSAVFSLKEEIQKLEDSPRRDLNIIGLYFSERDPDLRSREQLSVAIRRHLRSAKSLVPFTDNQILDAIPRARKLTQEWTLETLVKVLSK